MTPADPHKLRPFGLDDFTARKAMRIGRKKAGRAKQYPRTVRFIEDQAGEPSPNAGITMLLDGKSGTWDFPKQMEPSLIAMIAVRAREVGFIESLYFGENEQLSESVRVGDERISTNIQLCCRDLARSLSNMLSGEMVAAAVTIRGWIERWSVYLESGSMLKTPKFVFEDLKKLNKSNSYQFSTNKYGSFHVIYHELCEFLHGRGDAADMYAAQRVGRKLPSEKLLLFIAAIDCLNALMLRQLRMNYSHSIGDIANVHWIGGVPVDSIVNITKPLTYRTALTLTNKGRRGPIDYASLKSILYEGEVPGMGNSIMDAGLSYLFSRRVQCAQLVMEAARIEYRDFGEFDQNAVEDAVSQVIFRTVIGDLCLDDPEVDMKCDDVDVELMIDSLRSAVGMYAQDDLHVYGCLRVFWEAYSRAFVALEKPQKYEKLMSRSQNSGRWVEAAGLRRVSRMFNLLGLFSHGERSIRARRTEKRIDNLLRLSDIGDKGQTRSFLLRIACSAFSDLCLQQIENRSILARRLIETELVFDRGAASRDIESFLDSVHKAGMLPYY